MAIINEYQEPLRQVKSTRGDSLDSFDDSPREEGLKDLQADTDAIKQPLPKKEA